MSGWRSAGAGHHGIGFCASPRRAAEDGCGLTAGQKRGNADVRGGSPPRASRPRLVDYLEAPADVDYGCDGLSSWSGDRFDLPTAAPSTGFGFGAKPDLAAGLGLRRGGDRVRPPKPSAVSAPRQDSLVRDVLDAIRTADSAGPRVVAPPGASGEECFEGEVRRIVACRDGDHVGILGLHTAELTDMQVVQSKYRRLMRLLHPDKRRKEEEARAGGKERCDEAVRRVQKAVEGIKQGGVALSMPQEEPEHIQRMRRMQEIQRTQARQAHQRQEVARPREAELDVGSLLGDLSRALGGGPAAWGGPPQDPRAVPRDPRVAPGDPRATSQNPGEPDTTAQIMGLLASLPR